MGVGEADHMGHTSEYACHASFDYYGECLEQNNDPKGGGGVVGGRSRFL